MSADTEFSGCPFCSVADEYINIGRDHYFVCGEHETAWCVGSNLFSGWYNDTEEDQRRSRERLQGFTIVKPRSGPLVELPSPELVAGLLRRIGGAA